MQTLKRSTAVRAHALSSCSHFEAMSESDLKAVADITLLRRYETGEFLFFQDDPADAFFIVVSGRVNIHRTGADGREQVLHIFGAGEMGGEVPVFEGDAYPASARALEELDVLWVPRKRFVSLCRRQPAILLEMLAVLSRRLRKFVNLIDDLSLKEVSARLAKFILDGTARTDGNELRLDCTKTMLAARLGTIAETLSRTLRKMQKRGIIEVDGRRICIRDRNALIELAAGMKL